MPAPTSGEKTPSATVVIDETQIMWVVGGDIGGGTLHFGGTSYKFKTAGLKLGGFGVHKVKLTGDVYDLKDVADFAGAYGAAEAGVTVGNASKGDFRDEELQGGHPAPEVGCSGTRPGPQCRGSQYLDGMTRPARLWDAGRRCAQSASAQRILAQKL